MEKRIENSKATPVDIVNRTFEFACRVVRLSQYLYRKPFVGRILANQLLRAGTSVGENVEEAQAAQSKADFVSKFSIALKEARETRYWLRILVATNVVQQGRIAGLRGEAEELMRILGAIIVSAKRRHR